MICRASSHDNHSTWLNIVRAITTTIPPAITSNHGSARATDWAGRLASAPSRDQTDKAATPLVTMAVPSPMAKAPATPAAPMSSCHVRISKNSAPVHDHVGAATCHPDQQHTPPSQVIRQPAPDRGAHEQRQHVNPRQQPGRARHLSGHAANAQRPLDQRRLLQLQYPKPDRNREHCQHQRGQGATYGRGG